MGTPVKLQIPFPTALVNRFSSFGGLTSLWRSQLGSLVATGVDFAVTFALTESLGVWYVASTALGALSGAVTHFSIARHWAFSSGKGLEDYLDPHSQQFLRYLLVSAASLALNTALVFGVTEGLDVPYGASKVVSSILVGVGFNYPLHSRFVFRRASTRSGLNGLKLGLWLMAALANTGVLEAGEVRDQVSFYHSKGLSLSATDPAAFAVEGANAVYGRVWKLSDARCPRDFAVSLEVWKKKWNGDPQKGWVSRGKKELEQLESCASAPCFVKLTDAEGQKMGQALSGSRLQVWTEAVDDRLKLYLSKGVRQVYERGVPRFDPWDWFAKAGLPGVPECEKQGSNCLRPGLPASIERVTLEPRDEKPIRQLIDRRSWIHKEGKRAGWVSRDVYSEHYFDSWGEWVSWECLPEGGVLVRVWLAMEVDLLSKTNPLIRMARGRIIDGLEERAKLHAEWILQQALGVFQ